MERNIYIEVGKDLRNELIHIISNNKRYFTLEGFRGGVYVDCYEVASKVGGELDNAKTAIFKPLYEKDEEGDSILVGYELINES